MSFRLVPNSVTLNDLQRSNSLDLSVISLNSVAFGTHYVKWLKITATFCGRNVGQRIQFLAIYHLWRYCQGITPSESVKVRHSPLASENLTITWKRCKIGRKLVLITYRRSYMNFRLVLKSVTLNDLERRNGSFTLRYFNKFVKPTFQLITASSSIELADQKSASVTHTAVKLVCVTKFTHSRVEWISLLLSWNLSFMFRFTVVIASYCDAWLPVYSKHCVAYVCAKVMRESIVQWFVFCSTCKMSS